MGFGVWGLGLGFGVWGLGFGVWGLGFGVWGLGFGVWGLGFGVWGLGFGVWGDLGGNDMEQPRVQHRIVGLLGMSTRVWSRKRFLSSLGLWLQLRNWRAVNRIIHLFAETFWDYTPQTLVEAHAGLVELAALENYQWLKNPPPPPPKILTKSSLHVIRELYFVCFGGFLSK